MKFLSFKLWLINKMRFFLGLYFWSVVILVGLASEVRARDIVLFNKSGAPIFGYAKVRESILPGDFLVFSKEERFKVERLLGCGNTSCIYELADFPGQALRVPRDVGLFFFNRFNSIYFEYFIDEMILGKAALDQYQVPSIKIYEGKSNEFVRVEKITSVTSLSDFLAHPFSYSEPDRIKMETDLLEFAKSVSFFRRIGDFYADQIHYVKGRGWILLDWTSLHKVFDLDDLSKKKKEDPFDLLFDYRKKQSKKMKSSIRQKRWLSQLEKKIKNAILYRRDVEYHRSVMEKCLSYFSLIRR